MVLFLLQITKCQHFLLLSCIVYIIKPAIYSMPSESYKWKEPVWWQVMLAVCFGRSFFKKA